MNFPGLKGSWTQIVRSKVHPRALIRHLQVAARGTHAPLDLDAPSLLDMFQLRYLYAPSLFFLKGSRDEPPVLEPLCSLHDFTEPEGE